MQVLGLNVMIVCIYCFKLRFDNARSDGLAQTYEGFVSDFFEDFVLV